MVFSGLAFEQLVAQRIQKILPALKLELVERRKKISGKREVDLYLKDQAGRDYYVEIKTRDCTRMDIGRVIEYKAQISQISPGAQLILVCRNIPQEVKKVLENTGIRAVSFEDLGLSESLVDSGQKTSRNLSPKEERAYFGLLKHGSSIVSTSELAALLRVSGAYAMKLLASLNRKGLVFRIGRGRYVVIPADAVYERRGFVGDPVVIASKLLSGDYFVAYQSAATLHGLAEQLPFVTTVAIPYRKRSIAIGSSRLEFVIVKKDRFVWGIEEMNYSSTRVKVSDFHRTILDCVDRSDLCGGFSEVVRIISNAIEQPQFNGRILAEYAKRLGNRAAIQRLGFILERTHNKKTFVAIKLLNPMKSDFTYPLDPRLGTAGRLSKKWRIIENARLKG